MRKIKLLTPIISAVAVGSVVAPIATLTSCAKTESGFIYSDAVKKDGDGRVIVDGSTKTHTIRGFRLGGRRQGFGLNVKVINQSFSAADLTATIVMNPDELTFSVEITFDIINARQVVNFDLEFTNARGQSFVDTGYSFDVTPVYWNREDADYVLAYGEKKGHKYYFDNYSNMDDDEEESTIYDMDDNSWEKDEFDMELWLNPNMYDEGGINSDFMDYFSNFNSPVHILDGTKNIESYFMYECYKFNQPIVIPNSTEEIECDFLEECTNFNSTVTINCDNLTSFDMECFMYNSTYKDTTVRFVNSCFYDEGEDIVEYVDCAFCFDGDEGDYKKAGCCTIIVDDKQEAEALENILTEDGEYPLDGCYRYGCYRKVQIMVAE